MAMQVECKRIRKEGAVGKPTAQALIIYWRSALTDAKERLRAHSDEGYQPFQSEAH